VLHLSDSNDAMVYGQTAALLRWAGRRSGLYPADPLDQLLVDAAEECMVDIKTALVPQWYRNTLPRDPRTGKLVEACALTKAQQASVQATLNEGILPKRFGQLEMMIAKSGGPYITGKLMRTCDLMAYGMITGMLDGTYCDGITKHVISQCPLLNDLVETIESHPKVAAWNARGGKGGMWPTPL